MKVFKDEFLVSFMARRLNAIGVFYCVETFVYADSEGEARDIGWDKLQEEDYEIRNFLSAEPFQSEPDDHSDEEWGDVERNDNMCEGDYLRFD